MALLSSEEQTVSHTEHGFIQHLLVESAEINRHQAARRLRALGAVGEAGTPAFLLTGTTPTPGATPVQD
jgi:hypothetical protein